jgi:predicted DNA-binding ribbon-helix-helix protein
MLINRNITVNGHRTSIRLEPEFWRGLADIARRENLSIDELCGEVDRGAGKLSRTAAIRVFIASYMARRAAQPAEQPLRRPFVGVEREHSEPRQIEDYPLAVQRFRAAG